MAETPGTGGAPIGPQTPVERADTALNVRTEAARIARAVPLPDQRSNGDDERFRTQRYIASHTKGLPHNFFGEVESTAYETLLTALRTGEPADFDAVPLGGANLDPSRTPFATAETEAALAAMASATATASASPPGVSAIPTGDALQNALQDTLAQNGETFTGQVFAFDSQTEPASAGSLNGRVLQRRLENPQAALAFDLEGTDSHQLMLPPAPAFDSPAEAAEMAELYWLALARDVPFADYATNDLIRQAAQDLERIARIAGQGNVPPQPFDIPGIPTQPRTLFRSFLPGDQDGPLVSQFLLRPIPFGPQVIRQPILTAQQPARDFVTGYLEWLRIQNGLTASDEITFDPTPRLIRNGRDLSLAVRDDFLWQHFFNACQILLAPPREAPRVGGLGVPRDPADPRGVGMDPNNPYVPSRNQIGFVTFGSQFLKVLLLEVSTRAEKAVWYQKWSVHRRLRPEEFGGRVHNRLTFGITYPIHPALLEDPTDRSRVSPVLQAVARHNQSQPPAERTYLLPQAFPEGSPLHPAYGAGHAVVAGACATILKALFDTDRPFPDTILEASADGLSTVRYTGSLPQPGLTVTGEINKLASNIALGRDHAGVHWRSDSVQALRLGEEVAISLLSEMGLTYNEDFGGFRFTRFDGTPVVVGARRAVGTGRTGTRPDALRRVGDVTFPDTRVGSAAAPITVETVNQRSRPLTITSVQVDAPFTLVTTPPLPATLQPGERLALTLTFTPSTAGDVRAIVNVRGGQFGQSLLTFWALGRGVPAPTSVPVPVITGLLPTSGPPGTTVTLLGENLAGATSVRIGAVPANFSVVSSTVITMTVPRVSARIRSGFVEVRTPAGMARSTVRFIVTRVPIGTGQTGQTEQTGQPGDETT